MKVNPNRELPSSQPVARPTKRPPAESGSTDLTDFSEAAKLRMALNETDAVRATVVEKAKRLIADPNYPDANTIHGIAQRIAANGNLPKD